MNSGRAVKSGRSSWMRWTIFLLAVLAVAGVSFWAGRVTLHPQSQTAEKPAESSMIEVKEQELGRVITVTTTVSRPQAPVARNALQGVVTQAARSGDLAAGTVLYTVGRTPVILSQGQLPFWRALGPGDRGEDVKQFQAMLVASGVAVPQSGHWDEGTARAWSTWLQKHSFPAATGVELGQLVAVESLPAALTIDQAMARKGAVLSGGEEVISSAGAQPTFAMELTQSQSQMIPPGTPVTVRHEDHEWVGVSGESTVSSDGQLLVAVTDREGGLVCGSECDALPVAPTANLLTDVNVVPPQKGPVVPVSAITTAADGSASVLVGDSLEKRPVTVRAVADGLAVVDGVEPGESVRVLAVGAG